MRGDWKDDAMEYHDMDRAAQERAEAEMASRHTPGPWTYLEHRRDAGDAERTIITIRDARHLVLATLDRLDYAVSGEETRANACLIALAPRMAAALRALARWDLAQLCHNFAIAEEVSEILRELDGGARC